MTKGTRCSDSFLVVQTSAGQPEQGHHLQNLQGCHQLANKKRRSKPGTARVNEEWQAAATILIKRKRHIPRSSKIFLLRPGLACLSQSITNTIVRMPTGNGRGAGPTQAD